MKTLFFLLLSFSFSLFSTELEFGQNSVIFDSWLLEYLWVNLPCRYEANIFCKANCPTSILEARTQKVTEFCPNSSTEEVNINSAFTTTIPLKNIPQEATKALSSYLDMIKVSRPLPEAYLLESYTIHNNTLELKGRFLQEGEQDLYLGTFVWGNVVFSFPHLTLNVKPVSLIAMTPQNIFLPFPQFAYTISQENLIAQKKFLQKTTENANTLLNNQKKLYYSLLSFILLSILLPFLHLIIKRNLYLQKQEKQELSLKDALEKIQHQKTAVWKDLLILLRKISQKGMDVTAYELAEYFSLKGENNLAHASLLIEQYGYRNEPSPEQFSEAISAMTVSVSSEENTESLQA